MKRRTFLKGMLAASATLGIQDSNAAEEATRTGADRPNIVFLLTDDQNWRTMGCAGNPIIVTPNMDRLAAEGVMFTNNFVTTSICNASRASIFTGLYMGTHQVVNFDQDLTPELESISYPWLLRNAGYHVGFVGKYGVGNNLPAEAFDYWDGFPGQNVYFHRVDGKWKHLTEMLGDSSVRCIRSAPRDRPLCLSVSFKAPHVIDHLPDAFLPDPKYDDLYQDATIPIPETCSAEHLARMPDFLRQSINAMRSWRIDDKERFQDSVKKYYRTLTGVDDQIGRIREALRETGRDKNTVIVLTSDNGYFLGEHHFEGKWLMHEESIRTPMIVADPRLPAERRGMTVDPMTLNIDCSPTILDLAGIPIPEATQGRSLVPFLRGEVPADWRKDWFYEYLFEYPTLVKSEGVRGERWKYIRYLESDPVYEELFDLDRDPQETCNLALLSEHRDKLQEMRKRYHALRAEYINDRFPHPGFPSRPDPRFGEEAVQ